MLSCQHAWHHVTMYIMSPHQHVCHVTMHTCMTYCHHANIHSVTISMPTCVIWWHRYVTMQTTCQYGDMASLTKDDITISGECQLENYSSTCLQRPLRSVNPSGVSNVHLYELLLSRLTVLMDNIAMNSCSLKTSTTVVKLCRRNFTTK